ncbi:MAG: PEP-CTERM sorting domain-containing protein [Phenylobacterium sp.]|uniref:PEPxxWA-CTERM sorting domain-containing protein n=1 Tax=Phenylobacterium sp. TaxID=1871053 RepID=UPI001A5893A2|nr:PEPxxWA-CTERM sorting domain-containing protein [Phenylobacterium sp.]MBL8771796.1 PEP-CTERM sorting domain-containing protein [Phenylobacterium sp.]
MKFAAFGAVVAAGVLAIAGQAAASTWVATYRGVVDGGYDTTGVFGTSDTALDGLAFVATFTYDTEAPFSTITPAANGEIGDGLLIGSTITIGGTTFDLGSGFTNQVQTHSVSPFGAFGPGYAFHTVSAFFEIPGLFSVNNQLTLDGATAAAGVLAQAVAESPVVNAFTGGPASFSGYLQIEESSIFGNNSAYAFLRPDFYSVSEVVTGGVPEPTTWALMILGFGAAGSALRRRRTAPAG